MPKVKKYLKDQKNEGVFSFISCFSFSKLFLYLVLVALFFIVWNELQYSSSSSSEKTRKQFEHYLLERHSSVERHRDQLHQILYESPLYFQKHTHSEQDVLQEIQSRLRQVYQSLDHLEFYPGKKSYTINKKKVYLCLKDEHGEYYHLNMLMYVALHEMAHCLCDEIGHTKKFYAIFDSLLELAHEKGVYNKQIDPITPYCEYAEEDDDEEEE